MLDKKHTLRGPVLRKLHEDSLRMTYCGLTVTHDGIREPLCLSFCLFSPLPSSSIMSYHREWDRGKDDNYHNQTGSLRDREEDYYNDNKRRKFNNGVRLSFLSTLHTSSPN